MNKFYTKETKKEKVERIKSCKFVVICGNLYKRDSGGRVCACPENKVL